MKDTYSVRDLMERYACAKSTLFRMMKTQGYPRGGRGIGSRTKIAGTAVYDWETKHMPWLHPLPDQLSRMEEDERWTALKARHEVMLSKAAKKDVVKESQTRHDWFELQRIEKRRIDAIKARHGKKKPPVA